jgi:hypothetical protein
MLDELENIVFSMSFIGTVTDVIILSSVKYMMYHGWMGVL